MKVTVIKNNNQKETSILSTIIILIIGFILLFDAESLVNTIFTIIGAIVIIYGLIKLLQYHNLKKINMVNNNGNVAIVSIIIGVLIIILSNILTNAINIITGIGLILVGISKLSTTNMLKEIAKKEYVVELVSSIIIIILGVYTILAQNVIFKFIGILLIIYGVYEIISYFRRKA